MMNHHSAFPASYLSSQARSRLALVITEMNFLAQQMIVSLTKEINDMHLPGHTKQRMCQCLTQRWQRPPAVLVDNLSKDRLEFCVTLQEVWQDSADYDIRLTPMVIKNNPYLRMIVEKLRSLEATASRELSGHSGYANRVLHIVRDPHRPYEKWRIHA